MNEVQVTCQVVSAEKDIDPDIPAMIGTSAALALSGIPFAGPIGAAELALLEKVSIESNDVPVRGFLS